VSAIDPSALTDWASGFRASVVAFKPYEARFVGADLSGDRAAAVAAVHH
jgi:hypothetical protein